MVVTPDFLKNRSTIDNRYSLTDVHIDDYVSPGRRRYGLWKPAPLRPRPELPLLEGDYSKYTVTSADTGRIDLIAYRYYEQVTWWWVIATYNKIANPLTDMEVGQVLRIPKKEYVTQIMEQQT